MDLQGRAGITSIARWNLHSEKLEKAGTVDFKKHPTRKVGTRSRQCGPKVPGRFAFPGARNPRICSISRFGYYFPAVFPVHSRSFPSVTCYFYLKFRDVTFFKAHLLPSEVRPCKATCSLTNPEQPKHPKKRTRSQQKKSHCPKWLGEGAKCVLTSWRDGLPRVFCTSAALSCTPPPPVQQPFGLHAPKHLLHPLLSTLGTFEVSNPCSCSWHSGSQDLTPLYRSSQNYYRQSCYS